MAKTPGELNLDELVKQMEIIQTAAKSALAEYSQKETELDRKIYLAEQGQVAHEAAHRICGIASQPPITDGARSQIRPEMDRLKQLIKEYRNILGYPIEDDF